MMDFAGRFLREYEAQYYTADDRVEGLRIFVGPDYPELPDVSFYQLKMDFGTLMRKTNKLVARAGQGARVDEQFNRNQAEALARAMYFSSYWFHDGRFTPQSQAILWASVIQKPTFPILWTDWETNYGGLYEGLPNAVRLMQEVEQRTGVMSGMYTGFYWMLNNSDPVRHKAEYAYLATRPLWLAWYANASVVRVPSPWADWTLWQFGAPERGAEFGAGSAAIDLNRWNGTEAEWTARYGQGPSVPPESGGSMYDCTVKASATPFVNIRETASMTGKDIGDALPGQKFQADTLENGWLHAVTPFTGYVMAQYVDYVVVTPPPAPSVPDLPVSITLGDDVTYAKQTVNVVLKGKA